MSRSVKLHPSNILSLNFRLLMIAIISMALLSSCHSSRSVTTPGTSSGATPSSPLSKKQLDQHLEALQQGYLQWESMKAPVKVQFTAGRQAGMSGVLTMQRDRSIHLSLRFLGMEVASVAVDRDSIFAVYKLDRIYFAESIRNITGGFPATVGNLQDLLLGHAFTLGDLSLTDSSPVLASDGKCWTLAPQPIFAGMEYSFTIDSATDCLNLLNIKISGHQPVVVTYSDFQATPAGQVASETEISTYARGSQIAADININFRKAEWNKVTTKSISIPSGYTRLSSSDIMRILSKF